MQQETNNFTQCLPTYKKTTDVQHTWREHGWTPPSEDPATQQKWQFYRTLITDKRYA